MQPFLHADTKGAVVQDIIRPFSARTAALQAKRAGQRVPGCAMLPAKVRLQKISLHTA